jgi:hypothetical protein
MSFFVQELCYRDQQTVLILPTRASVPTVAPLVAIRFFNQCPYFLNTELREIQVSAKNKGELVKIMVLLRAQPLRIRRVLVCSPSLVRLLAVTRKQKKNKHLCHIYP